MINDDPGSVPPATTATVQKILRQHGYTLLDPNRIDGTVVLDGVGDSSSGVDSPVVEVQIGSDTSSIELTGACES